MTRFFLAGIFLSLFFVSVAKADFEKALEDFRFQFENYTKIHQEFLATKAKYQQFKTLPTETEAFAAFKKVLLARTKVLDSYFAILSEKLGQTPQIPDDDRLNLNSEITSARVYFADFEKRIQSAKNISETENLNKEFEGKRGERTNSSTKIRGLTFSANLTSIAKKSLEIIAKGEAAVSGSNLEDLALREEKLATAKTKIEKVEDFAQKAYGAFIKIAPSNNQFEVARLEFEGRQNVDNAAAEAEKALFAIKEAARGF